MKTRKLFAVGSAAAAVALSSVLISAPTASASGPSCNRNWFCLYYNSNNLGAWYGTLTDEPNLDRYTFQRVDESHSAGDGQPVKNNAASAWNRSTQTVRVYFNSGYRGVYDVIPARDASGDSAPNLENTKNNNASILWMQ
ncbi:peptidase inhibitor family I36 protein [Streptomyces orinoci]|uniref:Peptidase inhibitor family I36 protein n=1 Tax=Streptomyces orinoci TaxID=67339 RepID=A0ABV3K2A1_STRON|nr:peptidase inhibitor family I36 protein [Streptomyces orinoci]